MIHSSRVNRGSHLACTAGPANSCSSRMPPVCSWYIWPMLESPAEMAITTFISVVKSPPQPPYSRGTMRPSRPEARNAAHCS